jgi:hypothetical protein
MVRHHAVSDGPQVYRTLDYKPVDIAANLKVIHPPPLVGRARDNATAEA